MAKAPGNEPFDTPVIKASLMDSQKQSRRFNFGFGLASSWEDCGLLIDRKVKGRALSEQLKKMPASFSKLSFGTLIVEEGETRLSPNKEIAGMMKQLEKKFLKEKLNKFRPVLLLVAEDAEALEDETDEASEKGTEAVASEAASSTQDARSLIARVSKLSALVKSADGENKKQLATDLKTAATLLKTSAFEECSAALDEIENALNAAPAPQAAKPNPLTDNLKQALMKQVKVIQTLPDPAAHSEMVREMGALLQAGDIAGAAQALKALSTAISEVKKPAQTGDPLKIWRDAKESIDGNLSKLQTALKGIDHPVLARIAELGLNGATEGNQTAMMKALLELNNAPANGRENAVAELSKQVASYQIFLDSDPVIDLVENNPFGIDVPIQAQLGSALKKIAELSKAA